MKLRDWPEFGLIRPAGANRLIGCFKTVRTIEEHSVKISQLMAHWPK